MYKLQVTTNVSVYVVMTNKLTSSKLMYLLLRYLKNYIKLPFFRFTFLIFKDSFSKYGLQVKPKRLLLKKLKKLQGLH